MNNQNKSSSKNKNKDSNSSNKKQISLTKIVKLSPTFYQDIIEAENSFYEDPSVDKIERLILLYKRGSEYYSSINEDIARSFSKEVQNLLIHPLSVSLFKSNSKNKNVNKNTSSFDKNSSFDSEIKGKRKNIIDLIMKMHRVDSLDYSSEVKKIISKSNKSIFNFRSILKKEFSKQERILIAKRRRKKLFSDTNNDNICLDIYGRKSSTGSTGENK
ncbi:MAG: hypothetical protein MJ252_17975, partial [archaeon]|nr:hypothetical protein [archaeon]